MQSSKTFLIDTNVFGESPYVIYSFDEHDVLITDVTVEELDRLKTKGGETGANIRETVRILDTLGESGDLTAGVGLPGGGMLRVIISEKNSRFSFPEIWDRNSPDNRILMAAGNLRAKGTEAIIVTGDTNMRIKARILGFRAETFTTNRIKPDTEQYTGRLDFATKTGAVEKFYQKGSILPEDAFPADIPELYPNEFFVMHDGTSSALGKMKNGLITRLEYINEKPYDVTPYNTGQRFFQEALMTPPDEIPLVIAKGAAGSAKTFYALACGLEKVVNRNEYRKILISRPNIKFDDDIGYLKGSESEKIAPLIRPAIDNLELLCSAADGSTYVDDLFYDGVIEAQALAYMRGRSITNTWIIMDEFQNGTPGQAFGIVSRAGRGSKMILLGDPDQIDNPRLDSVTNGLVYTIERMKKSPLSAVITMDSSETVRSPLAREASMLMKLKGMQEAYV